MPRPQHTRRRVDGAASATDGPVLVDRLAETTSHRDREVIDHSVVGLLFEFLSARSVTLYHFVMDGADEVRMARRASLVAGAVQMDADRCDTAAGLPVLADDPLWQQCRSSREVVEHEIACNAHRYVFPLDDSRQVIGVLDVQVDAALQPRDATMVKGVLRILKNQLALLDYGERDTLTGLLNRKTFEHCFGKLVETARAQHTASGGAMGCWLGLVDIDHFKSINDQHGHLFGDEVLLLMSQIMKNTFRGADRLFRFGGEEFVIVLDRADAAGARVAFERLREAVREFRFPHGKSVTITVGYTRVLPADVVLTTCIERADAALYYGKQHGRDGVHEFDALAGAGVLSVASLSGDVDLF